MKKLVKLTGKIVLLALVLLLGSCDNHNSNEQCDKLKEKIKELEATIVRLERQIGSTERPDNIISSKQAAILFKEYNSRAEMIQEYVQTDIEGKPFEATRSLYYPIDKLRNYLAYINKISEEADVKPTGYRFYFAKYPDEYEPRKLHSKRQTFFIAPTIDKTDADGNVKHLAYLFDKNNNVILLDDILQGGKHGDKQQGSLFSFLSTQDGDERSTVANEINSSPPKGNDE